jgi:hypothetical protein
LFFLRHYFARNSATGSVSDSNKQPIFEPILKSEMTLEQLVIPWKIYFKTAPKYPFSIEVSSIGFDSKKISIISENQKK